MQLGSAFAQVATTLSWFIFAYRPLAELAAAATRLGRFLDGLDAAPASGISHAPSGPGGLSIGGLKLRTPAGEPLLSLPSLSVAPGEAIWLKGASGIGKTTLLKAIAGVWPHGSGNVERPSASSAFLHQQPYLPLGGREQAAAYPHDVSRFSETQMTAAFAAVGLDPAPGQTVEGLSGGEKQRLALARLFLQKPQWAFLDEATSALDQKAEKELFGRLKRDLPNTTFVIVSHRKPDGIGAVRMIELDAAVSVARPKSLEDA